MKITRLAGALALVLFAFTASAQTPLATYSGPDRMQKLIEGAKKEGEVVIYTSAPVDDMKALTDAFEKKYGVKAKTWRASSEKVMQRASWDFALVSLAAARRTDGGVRLVFGGVAPTPWRVSESVEEDVASGGLSDDDIATLTTGRQQFSRIAPCPVLARCAVLRTR